MGDPKEVLAFTAAIGDIFKTTYEAAGNPRQGWEATAKVAREMDFTVSDVIKAHADITGEGGIAARLELCIVDRTDALATAPYEALTTDELGELVAALEGMAPALLADQAW